MATHFSCLEDSWRFQHKGTCLVLNPDIRRTPLAVHGGIAQQNGMIPKCIGGSQTMSISLSPCLRDWPLRSRSIDKAGSSAGFIKPFQTSETLLGTGLWRIQRWYLAGTVHDIEQQLEHHGHEPFRRVFSLP